jgi:MFS superfamily sulfate permease-like transporter
MTLAPAAWLRGYPSAWLGKDAVSGLAAGAVVIPQAMAYATIANLPTEVGRYTCDLTASGRVHDTSLAAVRAYAAKEGTP